MRLFTTTIAIALALAARCESAGLTELDTLLRRTWPANRTINIVFHGHGVPSGYHKTPEAKPFESYPPSTNLSR